MSAEHRLTVAGIYGKHPGFGDFIAAGLPETCLTPLSDWMQSALGDWRAQIGENWQSRFDTSPSINFWIGPALLGGQALRGIWCPSRDKTGRRFPLVVGQLFSGPAPVTEPSQDFYLAASAELSALAQRDSFDPRAAANRLQTQLPTAVAGDAHPDWPTYWALNPERGPASLLESLRVADHAHAATCRSYWWFTGNAGTSAGVLACQNLPTAPELDWLFAGGQQVKATGGGENVA